MVSFTYFFLYKNCGKMLCNTNALNTFEVNMRENGKNKRKQKIINAAIEVIQEKNVEEATVREIAEKAGLTTGSIYHHYKNKDELLYDVINQSIHFVHKLSVMSESKIKDKNQVLSEVKSEVALRLSKTDEQKLHILLLSDVISRNDEMNEKYKQNYESIINKVADMFFYAFGIENTELKKSLSAIFIAALDGIAIQTALGVLPETQDKFTEIFNNFFSQSVPMFLEKGMDLEKK